MTKVLLSVFEIKNILHKSSVYPLTVGYSVSISKFLNRSYQILIVILNIICYIYFVFEYYDMVIVVFSKTKGITQKRKCSAPLTLIAI